MLPESLALPELMESAALWPWRGAAVAALAALAWALAFARLLRWPGTAPAAAAIGLLAGWWWTLGLLTASPRQLLERLPLLALMAALAGVLVASWRRPRLAQLGAWVAALAGGWWMSGAPMVAGDLRRAAPALLAIGLAAGFLAPLLSATAAASASGFAALAAGFWAAGPPGPFLALALAGLSAALVALLLGAGGGTALGLPMALALASLAALPVLARGAAADWLAAAAPLSALLLGPTVASWLPGRIGRWLGWALAALPAILGAVAATRFP
jgi:hypothetical protein